MINVSKESRVPDWPLHPNRVVLKYLPVFARRAGCYEARLTKQDDISLREKRYIEVRFREDALGGINWFWVYGPHWFNLRKFIPMTVEAKCAYDDPDNPFWKFYKAA